ncbi:hypothetical protein PFRI_11810 [Planktotalea frisia]|uniref:DUF2474 domain-containing protein n=1 Tax=Planktotalea frisia TaxID=696762 RepID=A0A1L9NZJ0_9RHOB|nr:hypothetical protein PFRI_11810 [Planktotalea frisia]
MRSERVGRLFWFVSYWWAGVLTVTAISTVIRFFLVPT